MKILLTGGGTAGHVSGNMALVPELKKNNYEIEYIGTEKGGTFGWPVVGPMRSGGGAAGLRSFARRRSSKVFATGMCATADGTGL